MNSVKNKLHIIQQKLIIIILEVQKIIDNNIININNTQHNNQYELLKDLIHILKTSINILDTILYLPNSE